MFALAVLLLVVVLLLLITGNGGGAGGNKTGLNNAPYENPLKSIMGFMW